MIRRLLLRLVGLAVSGLVATAYVLVLAAGVIVLLELGFRYDALALAALGALAWFALLIALGGWVALRVPQRWLDLIPDGGGGDTGGGDGGD